MAFIITLIVLLLAFGGAIFLMKYMKNQKLWNAVFCLFVFGLYYACVLVVFLDVGANDWNFLNTLPIANVSPFTFTLAPIILIMPNVLKKPFHLLISLLSVGMFLSPVISCIFNASRNYVFEIQFLFDYLAHFLVSLWGIYLVKSNQVNLDKISAIISGSIMLFVSIAMLILNLILDTSFFGLSLKGKHNIYNVVLVENSYLSALIFFLGLTAVLALGYALCKLIKKYSKN